MGQEDLEKLSEDILLERAKQQDSQAMEFLLKKYKSTVRKKARTLFMIGGDQDDLMQEGMIGLFKAIRDYNQERNTSFATFAELCIARQIYSAIKSSNRLKNLPLNSYISLYAPAHPEEDGETEGDFMVDVTMLDERQSPEDIFIHRETAEAARKQLFQRLSPMERQVMDYYLQGMTYHEIAKTMHKDPKSIDNALQRIRTKVGEKTK